MKEFKVIEVKEVPLDNGRKFTAYKTVAKNGRKMDLRFPQSVTNPPTEPCIIRVLEENANVDTSRQYPILWVKEIEEIVPFSQARKNNLEEYFD